MIRLRSPLHDEAFFERRTKKDRSSNIIAAVSDAIV
jgi:hypothetical protein